MCLGGSPRRRSRRVAIWAAVPAGSPESTRVTLPASPGRATAPTANSEAPSVSLLPCGPSAASASSLSSGIASGAEKRIGARTGGAIRTEAAIAPAQSSSPTRVTAVGCCAGVVEGKTARATPAALAAGSGPPIRVVLLVAKAGKASASATWGEGSPALSSSPAAGAEAVTSLLLLSSPPLAKTIATTMKTRARATSPASSIGVCDRGRRGGFGGGAAFSFGGAFSFCSAIAGVGAFSSCIGAFASSFSGCADPVSWAGGTSRLIGRFGITGRKRSERLPSEGVQFPKTG